MSLVSFEAWKRFQAEGRRQFIGRGVKQGVVVGAAVAASLVVVAFLAGKRPIPFALLLRMMIISVVVMAVAFLLWSLLLWELHRRKFSKS